MIFFIMAYLELELPLTTVVFLKNASSFSLSRFFFSTNHPLMYDYRTQVLWVPVFKESMLWVAINLSFFCFDSSQKLAGYCWKLAATTKSKVTNSFCSMILLFVSRTLVGMAVKTIYLHLRFRNVDPIFQ